ncbi:MAG: CoA-binding protein, partial [Gemmatimonadetes bacterium]|nr:CoA-binding protein [Gemmatimonadota bacterium]
MTEETMSSEPANGLRALFWPRSVAVVGASRSPSAIGRRVLDALLAAGFSGPVYPVNPRAAYIASVRCYPSVAAIGQPVDLAVIAIPAASVPDAIEDCARARVRGLVVISARYAETGEEGRTRQAALLEQVRGHGMRMIGPNCLGLLNTAEDVRLNASFAPVMPPAGSVALCSQSGALGIAIIALAHRMGLGFSAFVSVGNSADVTPGDLLELWERDARTSVVLLYLESFGDLRRFARVARRMARVKPIVGVKAGRTAAGARAAQSHTAALAGSDTVVDALFLQTGIIRADTLPEMFGIARVLTAQPLPRGPRVAVLTNAGGPAILCADALEASGLELASLSDATQITLRAFLPPAASTRNPVDMIASAGPEAYRRAVATLLAAEEVDALVTIYTPVGVFATAEIAAAIGEGAVAGARAGGAEKPMLGVVVGSASDAATIELPQGRDIPLFPFPEEIGRILGKVARYANWRRADPGVFTELPDQDLGRAAAIARGALAARGPGWLSVREARELLPAAGLSVAPGGVAHDAEHAVRLAE